MKSEMFFLNELKLKDEEDGSCVELEKESQLSNVTKVPKRSEAGVQVAWTEWYCQDREGETATEKEKRVLL